MAHGNIELEYILGPLDHLEGRPRLTGGLRGSFCDRPRIRDWLG